ncbi:CD9 antigen isoform X1 [Sebastes umbrosus]|uniref:CD9 antigen isoform X1 n=1 Tax=Sebastes umbrosus TaxID=72105 RepID=UPI00189DCBB9|nr:CD9 antigen isoform X1 [Sebastes umbrosus]XP_037647831.1 CD9 antigen isoform X1 [Sebastes umbrosus]
MALDGCGLVCKFILIIFNIVFAVLGFAFLGLGLWLRFSGSTRGIFEVGDLNSGGFVLVVTVLIVLGVVMLIVVAFGDYGACNEKRCSLQVFSVLLTILAVVLVAVGVLAYSRRDVVGSNFAEFYVSMYGLYLTNGGDPVIGVSLTFIHKTLHCCGLTGISLVELAKKTCPEPDGIFEHFKMDSCPGIILSVFDSKAPLVMGVFVGTGALLIIAVICSTTLSRKIRQSASSAQYIILTHATSVLANPQQAQHELASTSYSHPYQDPVIFTPLSVNNIPVAQA